MTSNPSIEGMPKKPRLLFTPRIKLELSMKGQPMSLIAKARPAAARPFDVAHVKR